MNKKKRVMIIAGEASGDMHGAHLVKAMLDVRPNLDFFGIGGHRLKEVGVEILVDNARLAVVGVSEALAKLKVLFHALRRAKEELRRRRPDLLIVIDFPDFNLHVAATAKKMGIPVLYYISPQIWAWRTGRIKKIKKVVDHMVVIFPFELDFYGKWNVPVTFVGHPLLDGGTAIKPADSKIVPPERVVVGLLPGSRNEEVARLLPTMVDAAEIVAREFPGALFPIPVASSVDRGLVESVVKKGRAEFVIVTDGPQDVFEQATLLITASGTVTLEAALAGTPMIVVYKVSAMSYWLGKRLIRVKHIGLANLVAGKEIVPELIQDEASAERIALRASSLLKDGYALSEMRRELAGVARRLGKPGASRRAAKVALQLLPA
jgi:lipid-A-disaccharide synthase